MCPICDELTVKKDVLALGCGHILCSDCMESMHRIGNDKECPFCKRHIYPSEVRRLFLNQTDPNSHLFRTKSCVVLSTSEQQLLDKAVLESL